VISASLQVASAIASRTRRLRIGTAVQVLPLNHPLRIAEEVATVRHDLLRDLRTPPAAHAGHRRVRAVVGAEYPGRDGLHVRERHEEAAYRFKGDTRPSDFFHRNVVLSDPGGRAGIRLRDVIGVENMMRGSDYPHSESTFPQSRKILAEILAGVPADEQAKIAGGNTARVYRASTWPA
jgi:Luciferase-like monooxygenase/Amidohydrolase